MKKIHTLAIISIAFSSLISCGGAAKMLSTPIENIDKRPLKMTPITEAQKMRWSHLDIDKDTIPGMSVDRAYTEILKNKKGKKVIVAIIDSGIDINHEDLKAVIWTNPKEVANNKKDDDNNGYIDDVNGWNFLGGAEHEQLEMTRIVKKGDDGSAQYQAAKAKFDKEIAENMQQKQQVDFIINVDNTLKKHLKKDNYTLEEVKAITSTDEGVNQAKQVMTQILSSVPSKADFDKEIDEFKDYVYDNANYNLNLEFDGRKVVGDNPNDYNDKKYGNNKVSGIDPKHALHGTHVAGIVAQVRNNKKGGDGVANNVAIMAIRAVPNGDEYDKDIAYAIRYAVDNGAKVINGSFGKSFSTNREWVYEAIKYAASKDVLFVHAAGNDGKDIDKEDNFPNDAAKDNVEFANNTITVGAIAPVYGANIVAPFSNYGKLNVDVFAPGVEIYATIPNNQYKYLEGTSMAGPNVSGVAALLRSYYPRLTAAQVKQILIDSVTPITTPVLVGESKAKMNFKDFSVSGGIVNAYKAMLLAEKMTVKP